MSGLNKLQHLDYAVYNGNLIVPLVNFDLDDWSQILDDAEAGLCQIKCRQRKHKKIKAAMLQLKEEK